MPITSDQSTDGIKPKTINEVSAAIRSAHDEPKVVESAQNDPQKSERAEGGDTDGAPTRPAEVSDEHQTSPVDGEVVVPEPRAKTEQELNQSPKEVLGEQVDKDMVKEMGKPDIPDGHANDKPKTADEVAKGIRNA